ncbi:unnamed protein product [Adineta steineri]|uniref:F-box domain-containing protein n=1 Tax=Adineta steineri TaxID=433720 RepID=A0A814IQX6_9BILA|nr:unnamed protein product [Adineta steineri]
MISQFEDLSNELIYEIFEYLDYYHSYQGFFYLNSRFRSHFTQSTLPLKINIDLTIQSNFNCFKQDIIIPNKQRIHSLRLSNCCMFHTNVFILFDKISLRTLVLENIQPQYFVNILHQLKSLRYLSSLTITIINYIKHRNSAYQLIFHLYSLRYCKLSLGSSRTLNLASNTTSEYSPIEYLIIDDGIDANDLSNLLSYVPHLRYFSANLSCEHGVLPTKLSYLNLKNLTHASFRLCGVIIFDDLEQIFVNLFHSIEVLHFTSETNYINANKWKQLISSYLPRLRIFDVLFKDDVSNVQKEAFEEQVKLFQSSFWTERQWFFEYGIYHSGSRNQRILYSTNPYRRKYCIVHERPHDITVRNEDRALYKSVKHVFVGNENDMNQYMYFFPSAIELTLDNGFSIAAHASISIGLSRILPLQQLKTLIINLECFSVLNFIELLSSMPNLRTLTLKTMAFFKQNKITLQRNEKLQLVSKTNNITNFTFLDACALNRVEIFVMLFPHLQHFKISNSMGDTKSMLQFLFHKTNENTRNLKLLCIDGIYYLHRLNLSISSGTLSSDFKRAEIGSKSFIDNI